MPKAPQDHKSKADAEPETFSFEHDGETYTFEPTKSVLNPGFVRRYRNATEGDVLYSLIEELADEDTLGVLDNMSFEDNKAVMQKFDAHVGALLGATAGK